MTDFTKLLVWVIDPKRIAGVSEKLLQQNQEMKIGNLILNSNEYHYLNNVIKEAVEHPNEKFRIIVRCSEGQYKNQILKVLSTTTEIFKSKGIDNLEFEYSSLYYDISLSLATLIDIAKLEALQDYVVRKGESAVLFDFDYIKFHNSQMINQTLNEHGQIIFCGKYNSDIPNFSPSIIGFENARGREFLNQVLSLFNQKTNPSKTTVFNSFMSALKSMIPDVDNKIHSELVESLSRRVHDFLCELAPAMPDADQVLSEVTAQVVFDGRLEFTKQIEDLTEDHECQRGNTWSDEKILRDKNTGSFSLVEHNIEAELLNPLDIEEYIAKLKSIKPSNAIAMDNNPSEQKGCVLQLA